jgi:hypothetical protein
MGTIYVTNSALVLLYIKSLIISDIEDRVHDQEGYIRIKKYSSDIYTEILFQKDHCECEYELRDCECDFHVCCCNCNYEKHKLINRDDLIKKLSNTLKEFLNIN